jgi:hypothetical protein
VALRVQTRDGERLFVPLPELRELLRLPPDSFKRALQLLSEAEPPYLEYHRRENAPSRGYLLPPSWDLPLYLPHIAKVVRELLREDGVWLATNDGRGRLGRLMIG